MTPFTRRSHLGESENKKIREFGSLIFRFIRGTRAACGGSQDGAAD